MIPRQQFINKLRELGYTHKGQTKRVTMWRKQGGVHFAFVPRKNMLSEELVTSTLRQCGESEEQIEAFVRAAKS